MQISSTYDAADRFSSVGAGGASVTASYEPLSRLSGLTHGAVTTSLAYDAADRLATLGHGFPSGGSAESWGFSYTPADQVSGFTSANSAWDWTVTSTVQPNTTADALNRNATIAAVGAPCASSGAGYDCNGNLTYDGTRTFTYDPENRLLTESGPVSMTLSYDPTGRLQQSVINGLTTTFLWADQDLVAEYSSEGVLRRYAHGSSQDDPLIEFDGPGVGASNASYLLADRQGSIVAAANSSGTLTTQQTYDAYGVPNQWSGTRFRYTGQIALPEAQLYYYKARVYDPVAGRFLQTDPVGYKDNLDLYEYAGDDPTKRNDRDGTEAANISLWAGQSLTDPSRPIPNSSPETARAMGATIAIAIPAVAIQVAAELAAPVIASVAVKHEARQILKQADSVATRVTRQGEKAATITNKAGKTTDISPQRVKEATPNTDPRAPPSAMQKTKFENSQPSSKGYKRDPTPVDRQVLKDAKDK